MNTLARELRSSVVLLLVFAVLLCGAYPLLVWAGAHLLCPGKAEGSLIVSPSGGLRGSRLIAQPFASPRYFMPRPSAVSQDALNSGGSNLGPTSARLRDQVAAAVKSYRAANGLAPDAAVPADAVTSSASGLDPHISLANARLQAPRVARERGLPLLVVLDLVAQNTAGRDLGVLGEPGVNVLTLNIELDSLR